MTHVSLMKTVCCSKHITIGKTHPLQRYIGGGGGGGGGSGVLL
jgi:hypothetical protein